MAENPDFQKPLTKTDLQHQLSLANTSIFNSARGEFDVFFMDDYGLWSIAASFVEAMNTYKLDGGGDWLRIVDNNRLNSGDLIKIYRTEFGDTFRIRFERDRRELFSQYAVKSSKELEWESMMYRNEVASSQGLPVRRWRMPDCPTNSGRFQLMDSREINCPRNILEEIVWYKEVELVQMKESHSFEEMCGMLENAPPPRNFIGALKERYSRTGLLPVITEVMMEDFNSPVENARACETGQMLSFFMEALKI